MKSRDPLFMLHALLILSIVFTIPPLMNIAVAQEGEDDADYNSSSGEDGQQESGEEYEEQEHTSAEDEEQSGDPGGYQDYEQEAGLPEVEASPFDDVVTISEDDIVTVNVLGNDRVYLGWDRSPRIVDATEPGSGQIIVNSDGTITYTPSQIQLPSGYEKADIVQYTASADGVSAYTGTITIWVEQVNDPPVAYAANYTIDENAETTFFLGSFDEDSDSLTYEVVSFPEFGQSELNPYSGRLVYTPLYEFSGKEYLSFQVSDGAATSDVANITITVLEVGRESSPPTLDDNDGPDDDDPLPNPGTASNSTEQDRNPVADAGSDFDALTQDLVILDGGQSDDADGDQITFSWSQKSGPDVTLEGAGTAEPTFSAPDVTSNTNLTFELIVSDGNSTDTASVTVTVVPISIDIIPNVYPNVIELSQPDTEIPVAIHGGTALDVSIGVDIDVLALGPASAPAEWSELTDVNADGFIDHVSYYRTGDLGLEAGDKKICLSGNVETENGVTVEFNICKTVKVKA